MIKRLLNKADAVDLFEKNAILLDDNDAIPFHRTVEIFEETADSFDKNISGYKIPGYFKSGIDYNVITGNNDDERPTIDYFYKSGFLKLVREHNYMLVVKLYKKRE